MPDRVVLSLLAMAAVAMIGLSLVWPQGIGARSPALFGRPLAPVVAPPRPRSLPNPH